MKKSLKKNKKGFTLVEMIVVIAIIGVLAAMMVPALLGFVDKAHESNKNAVASGLGRGIEAILFEPKWDGKSDGTYTGIVATKKATFSDNASTNTEFAAELSKIAGEGYENGAKITVVITSGKLDSVVYDEKPASESSYTPPTTSGKTVGIYTPQ